MVVKPSEFTSASTLEFARLFEQAGFPPGVFNVVTGYGHEAGAALAGDPRIAKVSFTGGGGGGRAVYKAAAEHFHEVALELGGKSPNIVFEDANLENAAHGAMGGIFAATGQTCIAGSRLLVQDSIHDRFVDLLAGKAESIRMGDPLDPATQIGPVATEPQFRKILDYIATAKAEGARCVLGGEAGSGPECGNGLFVVPTIFTRCYQRHADRSGRGVRARALRHPLQGRRGGACHRQRHGLRARFRGLDGEPGARCPSLAAHPRRYGLGQHVSGCRHLGPIRRLQTERHRTRERHGGDQSLPADQDRLVQHRRTGRQSLSARLMTSGKSFRVLSAADVAASLPDDRSLLGLIEQALVEKCRGSAKLGPRGYMAAGGRSTGTFLTMEGSVPAVGIAGAKIISSFADNRARGLPTEQGLFLLFDTETGVPVAALDAGGLTAMRTGATSAVGVRHLARKNARALGIVGAGETAYWSVRTSLGERPIDEVRVHARTEESRTRFAARLEREFGIRVVVCDDWRSCLEDADILIDATWRADHEKLIETAWIKPGALVIAFAIRSAFDLDLTDHLDRIFVDDWTQSSPAGPYGALWPHIEAGRLEPGDPSAEIGSVIEGTKAVRAHDQERFVFWHRGLVISDIMIAQSLLGAAIAAGRGTVVNL